MGIGISDVLRFPFQVIGGGGYGTMKGFRVSTPTFTPDQIEKGALKMGALFHPETGTESLLSIADEGSGIFKLMKNIVFKFLATARTQLANVTLLENIAEVNGKAIGQGLNLAGILKSELKYGDKIGGIFKLMGAGMGAPGIGLMALGIGALVIGAVGGFQHAMSEWKAYDDIKYNMSIDPVQKKWIRGGEVISALAMSAGSAMTLLGFGTAGIPLAIGGAVLTGGFMALRYAMGGVHPVNYPGMLPTPFDLPFRWLRDRMHDTY